jgi:hypothetical protein
MYLSSFSGEWQCREDLSRLLVDFEQTGSLIKKVFLLAKTI